MEQRRCPVVKCQGGKVKGSISRANHPRAKDVYSYKGIPFAEPPLGKLRFMPPEPLKTKWIGVLDGTKNGKVPIVNEPYEEMMDNYMVEAKSNKPIRYGEDCLNLNVFTPDANKKANLPVMVFFYGGGFEMGRNSSYPGVPLCSLNDVVLVVPNYRLHIYGFMSLGPDSCLPGNAGIWDQVMALRWVKDNIRNFGGNPDNVTIFGESAGSMSVSIHVASNVSSGLFHKAIYQTPVSPSSRKKDVDQVLSKLGITEENPEKILKLLQKCKAEDLTKVYLELAMDYEKVMFRNPSFDNKIFVKDFEDTLKEGSFNKVPQMFGFNSTEGHGFFALEVPNFSTGITEEELDEPVKYMLKLARPEDDLDNLIANAKEFYLKKYNNDDPLRFSKVYGDVMGDWFFIAGSLKTANYVSDTGIVPVYQYYGDFQMKCYHDEKYGKGLVQKPDLCKCDHGDDIFMSFGFPFINEKTNVSPKFTKKEKNLSEDFMKYLCNFATTGNPNNVNVPVQWPKYTRKDPKALSFDVGNIIALELEKQDVIDFWDKTY